MVRESSAESALLANAPPHSAMGKIKAKTFEFLNNAMDEVRADPKVAMYSSFMDATAQSDMRALTAFEESIPSQLAIGT